MTEFRPDTADAATQRNPYGAGCPGAAAITTVTTSSGSRTTARTPICRTSASVRRPSSGGQSGSNDSVGSAPDV